MPDNLVNIIFEADTSQLKTSFAQVEGELKSLGSGGGKAANFAKPIEEGAKKASSAIKETGEHLSVFGKFSEHAQEQTKEFGGELMKFGLAAAGIGSAFEIVKKSLDLAMEAETFHAQMTNILGDVEKANVIELKVEDISNKLAISEGRVEKSVKSLVMHGVASEKALELTEVLGATAKATGGSMEDLVDIADRIAMKGDEGVLSARELNRLAAGLGPEFDQVRKEYEGMDFALHQSNQQLEDTLKYKQRIYGEENRNRDAERLAASELREDSRKIAAQEKSAKDTFSEKTGETTEVGDDYTQWLKTSYAAKTRQGQAKYEDPALERKRKQDLIDRMEEGSQSIAKLTGRSQGSVDQAVLKGEYSQSDLLKASDESRMAKQSTGDTDRTRGEQAADLATREGRRAEAEQTADQIELASRNELIAKRTTAENILNAVIEHKAQIEEKAGKVAETTAGKMDTLGVQMDALWKSMGQGLFIMGGSAVKGMAKGDFGGPGQPIPGLLDALKLMAQQIQEINALHQTVKQVFTE